MDTTRTCPRCGRTIPANQAACTCSVRPRRLWLHSRETILLLTFGGLVAAFLVTAFTSRVYHLRRSTLARDWSGRGASDLNAGRAAAALVDFQTALIYARGDVTDEQLRSYELQLAQSLIAVGQGDEARSYLLDLWGQNPSVGQVNLELARLAARDGDDVAATRYYDSAISGIWDGNAEQVAASQRAARLELYDYLSQRGETAEAKSVLMAVAAALPADAGLHVQVGELMLKAGDSQQALEQFQEALRLDARNHSAFAGAGAAAFNLGDDRAALRYSQAALREQTSSDSRSIEQFVSVARASLQLDPYQTGLSISQRASRAASAYQLALARLTQCASSQGLSLTEKNKGSSAANPVSEQGRPEDDLQKLHSQAEKITQPNEESFLVHDLNRIDALMDLVFNIESQTRSRCGPPSRAEDSALLRIAQRRTTGVVDPGSPGDAH